jgi:ketosteroid isomerase-like protein
VYRRPGPLRTFTFVPAMLYRHTAAPADVVGVIEVVPLPGVAAVAGAAVATPEEALERTVQFFATGEGRFDLQHAIRSGELVVLAGLERQHGQVGGLPDQDWSLRVTLVFRRTTAGWELLHRHADPLVRPITFDHAPNSPENSRANTQHPAFSEVRHHRCTTPPPCARPAEPAAVSLQRARQLRRGCTYSTGAG